MLLPLFEDFTSAEIARAVDPERIADTLAGLILMTGKLLRTNFNRVEFLRVQGFAVLGRLLQKMPPVYITESVLHAVYTLMQSFPKSAGTIFVNVFFLFLLTIYLF